MFEINSEILSVVKEDIKQLLKKEEVNKLFKNLHFCNILKIAMVSINAINTLLFIIILISSFWWIKNESYKKITIIFIISILIINTILVLIVKQLLRKIKIIKNKIKFFFQNNNYQYLKMAFKSAYDSVILHDIGDDFTIEPQNFLIKYGNLLGNTVTNEKILVGTINGKHFNCGTVMHMITKPKRSIDLLINQDNNIYNRYLYFTCLIDSQDIITTIIPETLGSKIIGSNRSPQLESTAFEKLFALDCKDPVKLRKLLVPTVMAKMIDLANVQKQLPNIYINNNQITLRFSYKNIGSYESKEGNLFNFVVKSSDEKKITENIINLLNGSINLFINCYEWINSLDLLKNIK